MAGMTLPPLGGLGEAPSFNPPKPTIETVAAKQEQKAIIEATPQVTLPAEFAELDADLMPEDMQGAFSQGLPYVMFVWKVQNDPDLPPPNKFYLCEGNDRLLLGEGNKPYKVAALGLRKTIQEGYIDDSNNKRNKYYYEQFKNLECKTSADYAEAFERLKTDQNLSDGVSFLVMIFLEHEGQKVCTLAKWDGYKSMKNYIRSIADTNLRTGQALEISIEDHTSNFTKSKNGNFYPSTLRQKKFVNLTQEEMDLAVQTLAAKKDFIEDWKRL